LADWHRKEAALLYNSAFVANETVISTIAARLNDVLIFSDELNHNSLVQGIRQARRDKIIFAHNSAKSLKTALAAAPPDRPKMVICESIYSMDGDKAPLADYCDLSDEYDAFLYVDEVHAVGMYGATGAGVLEEAGLTARVDVIEGTLGKAIGVVGGYVAASSTLINYIRQTTPGLIFTTSLPPAVAAAASASIGIIRAEPSLRTELFGKVQQTVAALRRARLPVMTEHSHILPLFVGHAGKAQEAAECMLEQHAISVQPIIAPSVPVGRERLRITPSPAHSKEHIESLVDALASVWAELKLPYSGGP
jgi:5-aminolevulinate synthase